MQLNELKKLANYLGDAGRAGRAVKIAPRALLSLENILNANASVSAQSNPAFGTDRDFLFHVMRYGDDEYLGNIQVTEQQNGGAE